MTIAFFTSHRDEPGGWWCCGSFLCVNVLHCSISTFTIAYPLFSNSDVAVMSFLARSALSGRRRGCFSFIFEYFFHTISFLFCFYFCFLNSFLLLLLLQFYFIGQNNKKESKQNEKHEDCKKSNPAAMQCIHLSASASTSAVASGAARCNALVHRCSAGHHQSTSGHEWVSGEFHQHTQRESESERRAYVCVHVHTLHFAWVGFLTA